MKLQLFATQGTLTNNIKSYRKAVGDGVEHATKTLNPTLRDIAAQKLTLAMKTIMRMSQQIQD